MNFFEKIFGSYSAKEIKRITPIVEKIESYEDQYSDLTDEELKNKTEEFRNRIDKGESLDDILPEAFATVREAGKRTIGLRAHTVQLVGGVVLHQGRIAEMKTGEGKTLVAAFPGYLNALSGKGVHIITVNDYLAKTQRDMMGKIYNYLGLSVGCIIHGITSVERKEAYRADITYGTNNEFGFDYLRDNMVVRQEEMVQRDLNFVIIDEVDSILIDEARTPLIISGEGSNSTEMYTRANMFVRNLKGLLLDPNKKKTKMEMIMENGEDEEETSYDYKVDEKAHNAILTKAGIEKAERYFNVENLADSSNLEISHHVNQALKAISIMKKDIDYIVKEDEVIIVDQYTGRLMFGRRYSNGLHQAIEAKEGIKVQKESKTLATITFQNFFRMYTKLSGMTGTAKTEEEEFREIYNVDVIEIPTNKPVIREDLSDIVYKNEEGKFNAIIDEIKVRNEVGQPILVGTISIENSELISKMLKKDGIKHEVLNAKHHEKEAEIIAQAGRFGAVTIATNMAGRGTDIVLGGNPEFLAKSKLKAKHISDELFAVCDGFDETSDEEIIKVRKLYRELLDESKKELKDEQDKVKKAGGLAIIGTERHESRRIDNQLRGRSGRQGDEGASRFFISLEDDLMRLFAGDRIKALAETIKMPDDEPLEHRMLTKTIETAQSRVEGRNFNTRKHVLQYDNVMNKQREVIYAQRREVLTGESVSDNLKTMMISLLEDSVNNYTAHGTYPEEWDLKGLNDNINDLLGKSIMLDLSDLDNLTKDKLLNDVKAKALSAYTDKENEFGSDIFREVEKVVLLRNVDTLWMDHIDAMDQLKQGIGLRAYGNQDPVIAYKKEGFEMFEVLISNIQEEAIKMLFSVVPREKIERKRVAKITGTNEGGETVKKKKPVVRKDKKIGRNDACPCGSGKKYKNCCGKNA